MSRLFQVILQLFRLFYQSVERKGRKRPTVELCKLGEGLDPRQSERVQHGTGTFHDTQNGYGQGKPEIEADDDHDDTGSWALDAE